MLTEFSITELIVYIIVWAAMGGLPGFYMFAFTERNPRRGAQIGVVAGILIGIAAPLMNPEIELGQLFTIALIGWIITAIVTVVLRYVLKSTGNYLDQATIGQVTTDLAYGLLMPTLVIVFTIVVFPMIWNLVLAFRPIRIRDLRDLQIFSLQGLTLDNFTTIFRNSDRFFAIFWSTAFDTLVMLLMLIAGWFGGKFFAQRSEREGNGGSWIGLLIAFIAVGFYYVARDYGTSFDDLISSRGFLNTLLRTFIYTMGGTILAIFMGLVAALIVKDEFPGRNVVRGFLLFPYIAPVVSVVFIWTLMLNAQFGLVNEMIDSAGGQRVDFLTTPGVAFVMIILFQGWRYFPFAFLFLLARIQAIPEDMYEAAKVDGAAPSQRLLYVTLPQLRAVFGTLFVLRFIWTFNKFDDVFLLTGGAASTQLVTIEIYDQLFARSNIGTASATALVLAVVLFIVVGIYFKWFMTEEV